MTPSDPSPADRMASLGRALEVYRQWRSAPSREDPDTVLDRHPDLAELLDPLLGEASEAGGEPDGDGVLELDGYELEGELGRGGMGVVYRARDRRLGRLVAIKVLAPHLSDDPRSLARFRREAATVAALDHPGIVEIYGVGEERGRAYFAMEFVRGVPLDRLIQRLRDLPDRTAAAVGRAVTDLDAEASGAPPGAEGTASPSPFASGSLETCMVALATQLCEAVAHAHAAGVLHRDIKPANVLVTAAGRVVLTDFGLARTGDVPSVTVTGQFAGTPYYVSPEQARGDWASVGPASDVFSLGATLFEMLLLVRPFEAASAQEVLDRIRSPDPVATQEMRSRLPRDLLAILQKALEKTPHERYPTAQALADDLRAHAEMRPVSARQRGPLRRLWRWARREPLRASLGALLALGVPTVVGLSGYLLAKSPAIELGEQEHALRARQSALAAAYAQLLDDPWREDAQQGFRALLREDPGDLDAAVGLALAVLGRASGAEASFADVLAAAGLDVEQHPTLSAIARHDGDALRAAAEADGSAAAWHAAGVFLFVVGKSEADRGAIEQGLALLHRAVLYATRPVETYLSSLAHCAHALGLEGTVTQTAAALEHHFPDSVHTAIARALLLAEIDPEAAMAAAEHAVSVAPESTIALARLAALHHEQGRIDRAEALYRQILDLAGDHPLAITNLCLIAIDRGDLDAADALVDDLERLRPQDPMRHRTRARIAIARGDDAAAISHFEALAARRELDAGAFDEYAGALLRADRAADARTLVERARGAHPEDADLMLREAQAVLLVDGVEAGRKILDDSKLAATEGHPQRAKALCLRGAMEAMAEQWHAAIQSFETAASLRPLPLEAARNLVICLTETGRAEDAVRRGRDFADRFPTDRQLHAHVMDLLFSAGDGGAILDERTRFAEALRTAGDLDEAIRLMEAMLPLPPPPTVTEERAQAFEARIAELRAARDAGG